MTTRTRIILALLISLGLGFPGAMSAQAPPSGPDGLIAPTNTYGLEFVGQVGGTTNAVAVQGSYAYVGIGHRMLVLDVTDPAHPTEVARTELFPGIVGCLDVSGYYAYVIAGGLHVLNIMNPAHPTTTGTLPVEGVDIYVSGNYAYLAAEELGLRVVDIRTPSAPAEVAFHVTPDSALAVHVSGDHAYVAASWEGVRVLDVSDPTSPTEVTAFHPTSGYYYASGRVNDVFVSGDHAYTASGWTDPYKGGHPIVGLGVTDVSDPASPNQVGSYWTHVPDGTDGWAMHVDVSGCYAYVSSEQWYSSGSGPSYRCLYVADISAPDWVQEMSGPSACFGGLLPIDDLYVDGGHVYLALGGAGLRILDASSLSEVGVGAPPGAAAGARGCGRHAYVIDADALWAVDVSDPTQPMPTGVWVPSGDPVALDVSPPYGYLAVHRENVSGQWCDFHVVDLANPSDPMQLGEVRIDGPIRAVHVSGNTACLAGGEWPPGHWFRHYATLWVSDISDPASPSQVGSLRFYSTDYSGSIADDVYVVGHTAYVLAQIDWGADVHFWQVDVSDPLHPSPVVSTTLPGTANHLVVHKGHAYVTGIADPSGEREPTLWVLDVSTPSTPPIVGSCSVPGGATGIDVSLGSAYVTLGDAGLAVIDISSPASPRVVASYDTPGSAQGVQACGRSAYIADGSDGLIILHYTAPIPLYLPLALRAA